MGVVPIEAYVTVAGNQTVTGAKTFAQPPSMPPPVDGDDAANKQFVLDSVGGSGFLFATFEDVLPDDGTADMEPILEAACLKAIDTGKTLIVDVQTIRLKQPLVLTGV